MRAELSLISACVLAALSSADEIDTPQPPPLIDPRVSVRRSFGDSTGYKDGYTYLEGFLPLQQQAGSSLYFGGTRIVNYDATRLWETQVGGGGRWLLPAVGIVAGVNAFYDGRNTETNWYNQAGLGWEALGPVWQARGNVYLPVGQQNTVLTERASIVGGQFVRTNILLDVQRNRLVESAMAGVDVEAGRELPALIQSLRASAFVGLYSYGSDGVRSASGVRARLEAWLGESASLHLSIQHDPVFNTTVMGGFALHLGGVQRGARQTDPLAARLGERVVRDPNIVLVSHTTQQTAPELAIDPVTKQPLEIRHAASFAPAGGDGSVERPFNSLARLQAGSAPGQVLFAHAGSVFTGPGIVLQPGQRFFGEGVQHRVATAVGTYVIPRVTNNPGLPAILNPLGPAVTLANGTEVSGFRITTAMTVTQRELSRDGPGIAILVPGDGIIGRAITGVNIHRNEINAEGVAVKLEDVGGVVRVAENNITRSSLHGISYSAGGTTRADLSIIDNKIRDVDASAGARGISVDVSGSAKVRGIVAGNDVARLNGDTACGITASASGAGELTLQVAKNVIAGGGYGPPLIDGVRVASSDNGILALQLFGNTSTSPYQLAQAGASVFQAEGLLAANTGGFAADVGLVQIVAPGTFGFVLP